MGTVSDDIESMKTKEKSVDTEENRGLIKEFYDKEASTPVRKACLELRIAKSTLYDIMKNLNLSAYKIQLVQPLTSGNKETIFKFAQDILRMSRNSSFDINKVWFSDEAYFQLEGYVNKQNYRFWGTTNPHVTLAKPLHPKKLLVWCAINARGVFGPIIIDGTLNAKKYIDLLEDEFLPFMENMDMSRDNWFMQDGARPHRTKEVFETIASHFGERVIGLDYPEKQGEVSVGHLIHRT